MCFFLDVLPQDLIFGCHHLDFPIQVADLLLEEGAQVKAVDIFGYEKGDDGLACKDGGRLLYVSSLCSICEALRAVAAAGAAMFSPGAAANDVSPAKADLVGVEDFIGRIKIVIDTQNYSYKGLDVTLFFQSIKVRVYHLTYQVNPYYMDDENLGKALEGADVVIIPADVPRKPGMLSGERRYISFTVSFKSQGAQRAPVNPAS
ncbi:hypothetical protein M8C21_003954 [Ambrosia artemisiifolia]|uniref:Uncharacterized protein n=1 Tax=Ambrosia artemisiifolia TaxID=4212 RepID=A0AAD5C7M3_AMBAR|nr:hypothetical protein M8C21_003954 [Ambrosia artemisiifolia]